MNILSKINKLWFVWVLLIVGGSLGMARPLVASSCLVTSKSDQDDPNDLEIPKLQEIVKGNAPLTFRTALFLVGLASDETSQGYLQGLKDFCLKEGGVRHIRFSKDVFKGTTWINLKRPLPYLNAPKGEKLLVTVDDGVAITLDASGASLEGVPNDNKPYYSTCGLEITVEPGLESVNTADNTEIRGMLTIEYFSGDGVCVGASGVTLAKTVSALNDKAGFKITGKGVLLKGVTGFLNKGHGVEMGGTSSTLTEFIESDGKIRPFLLWGSEGSGVEIAGASQGNLIEKGVVVQNVVSGIHISSGSKANKISVTPVYGNAYGEGGKGIVLESGANNNVTPPTPPALSYDAETGTLTAFIPDVPSGESIEVFWAQSEGIAEGSKTQGRYFIKSFPDGKIIITDEDLKKASSNSTLGNKSKIFFTFTKTDKDGNTSAFSPAVAYPFPDQDKDGVEDSTDNCPAKANEDQKEGDGDGVGDACDNCPTVKNADQADANSDGQGDACTIKIDWKSWMNGEILYVGKTFSADQLKKPDFGEFLQCWDKSGLDCDLDGVTDYVMIDGKKKQNDNCLHVSNPDQKDQDQDGKGDACDKTPCPVGQQMGADGKTCEPIPTVECKENEIKLPDGSCQNCGTAAHPNADKTACQLNDSDSDGIYDIQDNCPAVANPDQTNSDQDGQGNACDNDDDNDGINDLNPDGMPLDNCPLHANADQADLDKDGLGNACDLDKDGDDLHDFNENCPDVYNPAQTDSDGDGMGDACDATPCPLDAEGNAQELKDGKCQPPPPGDKCAGKDCSAVNDACNAGVCDAATGECVKQPANEGKACDGNLCTEGDVCQNGACVAGTTKDCSTLSDACNTGMCNAATGKCAKVPVGDGQACDDNNACTVPDACQNGACVGVPADADGDGTVDCEDKCPADAGKSDPGTCGCGVAEGTCPPPPPSCAEGEVLKDGACVTVKTPPSENPPTETPPTETPPTETPPTETPPTETPPPTCAANETLEGGVCIPSVPEVTPPVIEPDQDEDGEPDATDNCPSIANPEQVDTDDNKTGDACEDKDGDGIVNNLDPHPDVSEDDLAVTSEEEFGAPGVGGGGCSLLAPGEGRQDPSLLLLLLLPTALLLRLRLSGN